MGTFNNKHLQEHYSNPRNAGYLEDADAVGCSGNPVSGDIMHLYLKIEEDRITDAKFKSFGCAAVIAVSSIVTESIKDSMLDRALRRSSQALSEALRGMPSEKMLYSVMVEQALERAIHDYRQRDPGKLKAAAGN